MVPKFRSGFVMRNVGNVWYPLCSAGIAPVSLGQKISSICQVTVGITDQKY